MNDKVNIVGSSVFFYYTIVNYLTRFAFNCYFNTIFLQIITTICLKRPPRYC